jgi:1-deoxy-D-xylulose-5-phosphate reductoisomerase
VIARHPGQFRVVALSCDSNAGILARQANAFRPEAVAVNDVSRVKELKQGLKGPARKIRVYDGPQGVRELAREVEADLVLMSIGGARSLLPLIAALESRKDVALASKEPLVSAGEIVMETARRMGVRLIPVDSEHSAVFQCLAGRDAKELKKIYLTGSGGPLRTLDKRSFDRLPRSRILRHPKWKMGKKISVDSATMMNKGLEVIEAKWLFGVSEDDISVLVHPEAVVHSLVEFIDGALIAQLAIPDMRLPIQYALNFPGRLETDEYRVDFRKLGSLSFFAPDTKKFPCLDIAYAASRRGGTYPAVLNAANEEAVRMYLEGALKFSMIPRLLERVLSLHRGMERFGLDDIIKVDAWAREEACRANGRIKC